MAGSEYELFYVFRKAIFIGDQGARCTFNIKRIYEFVKAHKWESYKGMFALRFRSNYFPLQVANVPFLSYGYMVIEQGL